jgi:phosphoribosyl 1,2-cyclic phosphate phosphodiesterase
MNITFLGTGGAWGVPEINCDCLICREMREREEKRERTALLISNKTNLLLDCGPDIRAQLLRNGVDRIDGVLISHEHGDHYMGLDELFPYKRNVPRDAFRPIPVHLTAESWEVIGPRFAYLEQMEVIEINKIKPGKWFQQGEFDVLPFRTEHGDFAKGSVGFAVRSKDQFENEIRLVYTSDFMDIPEIHPELINPDYLIIQSFWLNEPISNRPHHMSFQRAIHFIDLLKPKKETFLIHIGDADMVKGDSANTNAKKHPPKDPLRPPSGGEPYPIPLNQEQWQKTAKRIMSDFGLPYRVTVTYDDLCVYLS